MIQSNNEAAVEETGRHSESQDAERLSSSPTTTWRSVANGAMAPLRPLVRHLGGVVALQADRRPPKAGEKHDSYLRVFSTLMGNH